MSFVYMTYAYIVWSRTVEGFYIIKYFNEFKLLINNFFVFWYRYKNIYLMLTFKI